MGVLKLDFYFTCRKKKKVSDVFGQILSEFASTRLKMFLNQHCIAPAEEHLTLVLSAASCQRCRYMWRTTEWSDCRVDLLLSQQDRRRSNVTGLCGGGLQTREVYCVQANAELLKYLNDLKEKDKGKARISWIVFCDGVGTKLFKNFKPNLFMVSS